MILKKKLIIGIFLSVFSSSIEAYAQTKPVVGYIMESSQGKSSASLTVNGQKLIRVVAGYGALSLEERMLKIAKKCNKLIQSGDFDPERLNVALEGTDYVLKMGSEAIFTLDEASAARYRRPALLTMLELTNRFRRQTGALPLAEVPSALLGHTSPTQIGYASWYGGRFIGRHTASGTPYNPRHLTAAHPALPFGTHIMVTNLNSQKSVIVTVNDRGPFHGNRIIDLSPAAFKKIGLLNSGILKVRLDVLR